MTGSLLLLCIRNKAPFLQSHVCSFSFCCFLSFPWLVPTCIKRTLFQEYSLHSVLQRHSHFLVLCSNVSEHLAPFAPNFSLLLVFLPSNFSQPGKAFSNILPPWMQKMIFHRFTLVTGSALTLPAGEHIQGVLGGGGDMVEGWAGLLQVLLGVWCSPRGRGWRKLWARSLSARAPSPW